MLQSSLFSWGDLFASILQLNALLGLAFCFFKKKEEKK